MVQISTLLALIALLAHSYSDTETASPVSDGASPHHVQTPTSPSNQSLPNSTLSSFRNTLPVNVNWKISRLSPAKVLTSFKRSTDMSARVMKIVHKTAYIAASMAAITLFSNAVAGAAGTPVTETGSTLIYPLFVAWIDAYGKVDPNLQMKAGATGSSAGIAQAIAKQVQIGTSDAYLSDNEAMANPQLLNIPNAISAQTVQVNLPELHDNGLKLSGPILAGIYSGKISNWDDRQIADMNRGVSLPHHAIVPVRRGDGSGDTFIFTQFLTFSTPKWEDTI